MRKTFSEFFEILGYCEKEIEDQISQNNLITKKKKEKRKKTRPTHKEELLDKSSNPTSDEVGC